jgi:hypothetical protein
MDKKELGLVMSRSTQTYHLFICSVGDDLPPTYLPVCEGISPLFLSKVLGAEYALLLDRLYDFRSRGEIAGLATFSLWPEQVGGHSGRRLRCGVA